MISEPSAVVEVPKNGSTSSTGPVAAAGLEPAKVKRRPWRRAPQAKALYSASGRRSRRARGPPAAQPEAHPVRWISFDCFGTLGHWNGGFEAILRPFAGEHTGEVLRGYHVREPQIEREPYRTYRDVTREALTLARTTPA